MSNSNKTICLYYLTTVHVKGHGNLRQGPPHCWQGPPYCRCELDFVLRLVKSVLNLTWERMQFVVWLFMFQATFPFPKTYLMVGGVGVFGWEIGNKGFKIQFRQVVHTKTIIIYLGAAAPVKTVQSVWDFLLQIRFHIYRNLSNLC